MGVIAMLHYRKHPSHVKKAYSFAAVAKMEGIDFYYFSYSKVDFNAKKIDGWVYHNGKWVQKRMDFPKVIINASNPKTIEQKRISKRLKKIAIFTSHSVGNKMKVYEKILKGEEFADYLIPSIAVRKGEEVLDFFEKHTVAVIKPTSGNHGKKIIFIKKINTNFQVIEGVKKTLFEKSGLLTYIERLLKKQSYILQPFIECKTKAGLTYDFRLHILKNGTGKWEVTLIYPRVSGNAKLISNISSGGYRGEFGPFLKEEFGDRSNHVRQLLEGFAVSFATHFDTLYPNPFDELGIDVGLDQNLKIWIFEVNWRPGSKHREIEVARRLIPYCRYLASR
ncbi:YheC/YheD family protein [Bacillus dakarensis]|uniref:YheC/YheD family protein n=1 Tax=Robertmurraya dakarensis TaxID=1926278 RepID=UPI000981EE71|nr:YheC/YheD family protein [Bacillus dakarensis]